MPVYVVIHSATRVILQKYRAPAPLGTQFGDEEVVEVSPELTAGVGGKVLSADALSVRDATAGELSNATTIDRAAWSGRLRALLLALEAVIADGTVPQSVKDFCSVLFLQNRPRREISE